VTGGDGAQMQIAPMEPGDIPEALAIQAQAYPASLQAIGTLTRPAGASEVLYIHDLAIAPDARGLRMGVQLVARAFDAARASGLCEAELVAVEGAHGFWHRLGFREGHSAAIAAKLASYGADARWMRRDDLAAG